jgi:putative sterol carrier protein
MTMQGSIQEMIDKFHRKVEGDEKVREKLKDVVKTVNIDLGTESYSLRLEDAQIHDYKEGMADPADITIKTSPENLQALIDGTLRPMKAYLMKKVSIKGKIEDLMHLRSLF